MTKPLRGEDGLTNPASKILGTTIIIDNFIQMIAGVNEFHPLDYSEQQQLEKKNIGEVIEKYFVVHSIIRNPRRAVNLKLILKIEKHIYVSFCGDIFEYLVSILADNIWKYSLSNTSVEVEAVSINDELITLKFKNVSTYIPDDIRIFGKGTKVNKESEGYGYGLFWANILIDHYNRMSLKEEKLLELNHTQKHLNGDLWKQDFSLCNLIIDKK